MARDRILDQHSQGIRSGNPGVTVAKMGGSHLQFAYEELQDGRDDRRFRPRIGLATDFPDDSDTEAFMRDTITVTPLVFDWTATRYWTSRYGRDVVTSLFTRLARA
jgi:broad specificity polyphosphatase/5'/3'-nucleotidase SurE